MWNAQNVVTGANAKLLFCVELTEFCVGSRRNPSQIPGPGNFFGVGTKFAEGGDPNSAAAKKKNTSHNEIFCRKSPEETRHTLHNLPCWFQASASVGTKLVSYIKRTVFCEYRPATIAPSLVFHKNHPEINWFWPEKKDPFYTKVLCFQASQFVWDMAPRPRSFVSANIVCWLEMKVYVHILKHFVVAQPGIGTCDDSWRHPTQNSVSSTQDSTFVFGAVTKFCEFHTKQQLCVWIP